MKAKTKIIFGSAMTAAMCASLIAGSTFALFTSEAKTNIAITSGKVKVSAQVTDLFLSSNAESDDFSWVKATDTVEGAEGSIKGTFANEGTASYTVADGEGTLTLNNITPGDAVKFTLSITNESTVAMKYQVRVLTGDEKYLGEEEDPYPGVKLSSALQFGFGADALKTGLVYAATEWSSVITEETTEEKTVTIAFPRTSTEDQNQYQNRSCEISLTVLAVQGNAKETSYCDENGHVYQGETCIYCGEKNPYAALHTEEGDTYTINGVDKDVTKLYIPAEIDEKKVKLAKGAFAGNTEIESVIVGEGFTEFADAVSGSDGMFQNCTNLTSVTLPSTLEKINNFAFNGCKNLKNITIPEGVTEISTNAFHDSGLTSVEIPASVTRIGENAFSYISSLQDVILHEGLQTIGGMAFMGGSSSSLQLTSIKLPSTLNTIGQSAFKFTAIKEIEIPDSVTTIEGQAFYQCMNLMRVKIGSGVTKLSSSIFNQCAKLMSVEIGENVTEINDNVFGACYKLVEVRNLSSSLHIDLGEITNGYVGAYAIEVHDGESKLVTDENGFTFYTDAESKKYLVDYSGTEKVLTLPTDSEFVIHNYAFYGDKNITNIVFGDKVTAIGDYAFANMTKFSGDIKGVVLGENITSIGAHAFENSVIVKITAGDKLQTIGDYAFSGCKKMSSVVLGSTQSQLTSMGQETFKGCTMLWQITFKGSRDTWKELAAEKDLFNGISRAVTITCTDGKLDKNGAEIG